MNFLKNDWQYRGEKIRDIRTAKLTAFEVFDDLEVQLNKHS